MNRIATVARAPIVSALLLTVALGSALVCRADQDPTGCRGTSIVLPPAAVVPAPPANGFVLTPPAHPDARPWPHGMVITPPPINDPINLALPTPLDTLLSALLAPWRAATT